MKKNFAKISDPGERKIQSVLKFVSFLFTRPGLGLLKKMAKRTFDKQHQIPDYDKWIRAKLNPDTLQKDFKEKSGALKLKPKISIVIAAHDPKNRQLSASINSVIEQSYANWELLVSDKLVTQSQPQDERIRPVPVYDNSHTATILNALCAAASGDYILFMTEGDLLTPNCLFEIVKHINTCPSDTLIYTDEDIIENGAFSTPHFKPVWSPDSLLSRNYIGHTFVIEKQLTGRLSFREGYDDCLFYDYLLRATELADHIGRIPLVLFHCDADPLPANYNNAAKKALSEAIARRNTPGTVNDIPGTRGCFSIQYEISKIEKVSIIIPTKDNTTMLKTALDSIFEKTSYPDYEIIVLNNNSTSPEFFSLMKEYSEKHAAVFRCLDANFPFNFAKLMNLGVAHSTGTYILMCNNDIEIIKGDWLNQMVAHTQQKRTGAVGVKLLYPDNTIQHAGIVLGIDGASGHVFVNKDKDENGYFYCLKAVTNYSAVTAACMMCRKDVYNEAGRMDETLEVEYNDLDLCLKFLKNGYYNIYLPSVEVYHYESATRGHPFRSTSSWKQHEKDLAIFKSKWQRIIDDDPFYNPNLSKDATDFSIGASRLGL